MKSLRIWLEEQEVSYVPATSLGVYDEFLNTQFQQSGIGCDAGESALADFSVRLLCSALTVSWSLSR